MGLEHKRQPDPVQNGKPRTFLSPFAHLQTIPPIKQEPSVVAEKQETPPEFIAKESGARERLETLASPPAQFFQSTRKHVPSDATLEDVILEEVLVDPALDADAKEAAIAQVHAAVHAEAHRVEINDRFEKVVANAVAATRPFIRLAPQKIKTAKPKFYSLKITEQLVSDDSVKQRATYCAQLARELVTASALESSDLNQRLTEQFLSRVDKFTEEAARIGRDTLALYTDHPVQTYERIADVARKTVTRWFTDFPLAGHSLSPEQQTKLTAFAGSSATLLAESALLVNRYAETTTRKICAELDIKATNTAESIAAVGSITERIRSHIPAAKEAPNSPNIDLHALDQIAEEIAYQLPLHPQTVDANTLRTTVWQVVEKRQIAKPFLSQMFAIANLSNPAIVRLPADLEKLHLERMKAVLSIVLAQIPEHRQARAAKEERRNLMRQINAHLTEQMNMGPSFVAETKNACEAAVIAEYGSKEQDDLIVFGNLCDRAIAHAIKKIVQFIPKPEAITDEKMFLMLPDIALQNSDAKRGAVALDYSGLAKELAKKMPSQGTTTDISNALLRFSQQYPDGGLVAQLFKGHQKVLEALEKVRLPAGDDRAQLKSEIEQAHTDITAAINTKAILVLRMILRALPHPITLTDIKAETTVKAEGVATVPTPRATVRKTKPNRWPQVAAAVGLTLLAGSAVVKRSSASQAPHATISTVVQTPRALRPTEASSNPITTPQTSTVAARTEPATPPETLAQPATQIEGVCEEGTNGLQASFAGALSTQYAAIERLIPHLPATHANVLISRFASIIAKGSMPANSDLRITSLQGTQPPQEWVRQGPPHHYRVRVSIETPNPQQTILRAQLETRTSNEASWTPAQNTDHTPIASTTILTGSVENYIRNFITTHPLPRAGTPATLLSPTPY